MYYTTTTVVVVVAYLDEDNNNNTRSDDEEVVRDHASRRHWCENPAGVVVEGASPDEQKM